MTEDDATTELLIRARGFVERGWCQHTFSRDIAGNPTFPFFISFFKRHAASWSMMGALAAAAATIGWNDRTRRTVGLAGERLVAAMGMPVNAFNDSKESVEPVLAAFDRAIAAEGRG